MKTIWKYLLAIDDTQTVMMPEGATMLTVQTQGDQPCLWALVDPDLSTKPRVIDTHGTGHPIPDAPRQYIGTYQTRMGLVFHVFERTDK